MPASEGKPHPSSAAQGAALAVGNAFARCGRPSAAAARRGAAREEDRSPGRRARAGSAFPRRRRWFPRAAAPPEPAGPAGGATAPSRGGRPSRASRLAPGVAARSHAAPAGLCRRIPRRRRHSPAATPREQPDERQHAQRPHTQPVLQSEAMARISHDGRPGNRAFAPRNARSRCGPRQIAGVGGKRSSERQRGSGAAPARPAHQSASQASPSTTPAAPRSAPGWNSIPTCGRSTK